MTMMKSMLKTRRADTALATGMPKNSNLQFQTLVNEVDGQHLPSEVGRCVHKAARRFKDSK